MKIIILISFFLFFSMPAFSSINFINGKWSTTYNYGPCSQRGNDASFPISCSTVATDGITWNWGSRCLDNQCTRVEQAANFTGGAGPNGLRTWKGSGSDNILSGELRASFSSAQKELWIRWYERYESGFSWGGRIDVKSLYFQTGSGTAAGSLYTGFTGANNYRIYNQGGWSRGGTGYPEGNVGWSAVYPDPHPTNPARSTVSDGSWHCFEIYLKMDTDGTDGKGGIWINGNLVAYKNDVNWSGGNSTAKQGWTWFEFLSNQKDPELSRPYYVDLDDMVIYNQTPPSRDAHGNPFIGPLPPAPPEGLIIEIQ